MKQVIIIIMILIFPSMLGAATEVCPVDVAIVAGKYTAPIGWSITDEEVGNITGKLLFYIATYNYDHHRGVNTNRISCFYKDRKNNYDLEITSNKTHFVKPSNALWQTLDGDSLVCFPDKPLAASECGWDDSKAVD